MEQSSSSFEERIRHQFDRLCCLALKGEAANYQKHMVYRQKHEVMLSELSEEELSRLFTMDEYGVDTVCFNVLNCDIEIKNALIADALKELSEKKRNNTLQQIKTLPFSIIQAAVSGNVIAIDKVLKHYEGYIISLSTRRMYDEKGNQFLCVDETLKRRLEIKLITKILDFEII